MAIFKLSTEEISERLQDRPNWTFSEDRLQREFVFPDFVQAFGFMTQVALAAEKRDHHPEWTNVYGRVVIELTTHDCQGVSTRDFDLAAAIDELYARQS
jgi:4a-hydroxytetrahydrobiopterin dehydratase